MPVKIYQNFIIGELMGNLRPMPQEEVVGLG
jgi:hypothetical protein